MNHNNINFNTANHAATLLLQSFFNHSSRNRALINTPVYLVNQEGKVVTVQLSYYLASKVVTLSFSKDVLKTLINALTQVYESAVGQPVTVNLELVRQHQPYMDASILAQYLAINLAKQGFSRISNRLLNAVPYLNPDFSFNLATSASLSITGVKVQLSGLLTSQRNRSRKTTYTATAGTFSLVGTKQMSQTTSPSLVVTYGSYTSKSGLGAFTVKVWLASPSRPLAPSPS